MSDSAYTEVPCPGGCGLIYTRVDYELDPPPIPFIPEPGWAEAGSEGDGWRFQCPRCDTELEPEYQRQLKGERA